MRVPVFLCLLLLLSACTFHAGGRDDPARVADALRTRITQLEKDLVARDGTIAELHARLAAQSSPRDLSALAPIMASVDIDPRSGLTRDGKGIEILLRPLDGRQRFISIAGKAIVVCSDASTGSVLAETRLSSAAWHEAYRSSFLGTLYRVEVPLTGPTMPNAVRIEATVRDLTTSLSHRASRDLTLRP